MGKFEDLSGKRFGRLIVIRRTNDYVSPSGKHVVKWLCKCDCGNMVRTTRYQLKSGKTKSCGCYQKQMASYANKIHGLSKERLYYIWRDMRYRCQSPKQKEYCNYGARGISLCSDWYCPNCHRWFRAWHESYHNGIVETSCDFCGEPLDHSYLLDKKNEG